MARMNDRGQILLIGALTIAVSFVALGIVLNGSLHTPSIAAQATEDVTDSDLQRIHDTIERETAAAIERAQAKYPTSKADQRQYIRERVIRLEESQRRYYARSDLVVEFPSVRSVPGEVADDTIEDPGNPEDDYTTTEFRAFRVTPSVSGSQEVEIEVTDSAGTTRVIEINPGFLEVNGETCSYTSEIYLAELRTDQGACPALSFLEGGGSYDIILRSVNGGSADYRLFHRVSLGSGDRIYETRVEYEVTGTDIHFRGVMEVDPGEP